MNYSAARARRRHEHGAVAVEAAIVLPVLLLFLGLPSVFLAFYFLQYSAAEKAVHDAALYLATAPRIELTTSGGDGNAVAVGLARKIVEKELTGMIPVTVDATPAVFCIYLLGGTPTTKPCTAALVKDVNHTLTQFDVSINYAYVNPLTGKETALLVSTYASTRYVGN